MERTPLTQYVGRATRDPEWKALRDGTLITTKKGGKILGFGLAVTESYDDDAKPKFFDVAVFNEALQSTILSGGEDGGLLVYKGANLALEGTVEQKGDYNPSIAAMRVGLVTWLKRAVLEQPAQTQESEEF